MQILSLALTATIIHSAVPTSLKQDVIDFAGIVQTVSSAHRPQLASFMSPKLHGAVGQQNRMDYVVLLEKSDCVVEAVLKSLHKFASPRRVLVIAPAAVCAQADFSYVPAVSCIGENEVLPHVSKASTQDWLRAKFGKRVDDMRLGLGSHTMAGWYLQQFLKMGVAEVAEKLGLSENYVIWDSDMILLRDFSPFNTRGQVNLMEGDTGPENICNKGYQESFGKLTGLSYAYSRLHKKGFTTHHMVVNQTAMRDFLRHIGTKSHDEHWSNAVLEASCPNLETCSCGFSEYGSYASWMLHFHPEAMTVVPRQYERGSQIVDPNVGCCPERYPQFFKKKLDEGLLFVSFERSCTRDKTYVGTDKLPR
jgi:hypothetical protein